MPEEHHDTRFVLMEMVSRYSAPKRVLVQAGVNEADRSESLGD